MASLLRMFPSLFLSFTVSPSYSHRFCVKKTTWHIHGILYRQISSRCRMAQRCSEYSVFFAPVNSILSFRACTVTSEFLLNISISSDRSNLECLASQCQGGALHVCVGPLHVRAVVLWGRAPNVEVNIHKVHVRFTG